MKTLSQVLTGLILVSEHTFATSLSKMLGHTRENRRKNKPNRSKRPKCNTVSDR